eukprot:CAMPEP_0206458594 /NCGR_PEP_ID=MMETSP0324_2-20121206/23664_1 /ASSEMBLY_ACC=CAM_ASM_000836 /TAXON_ID=2866 /ORGANISM="Crypthecodinium cohnii, Strain Seligo" /LENGTH=744 /DNA_ID=CAMNT_0053929965 /DNA_START=30 /DNA_END=2264 /DNA_ORIENTATION=-
MMQGVDQESHQATSWYDVAQPVTAGLLITILLAVDDLNPVKVFCSYAQYWGGSDALISEGRIGLLCAILLVSLAVHMREELLYTCVKLFFRCTFNNVFFSSVEIVGMDNLPKTGPVILTGNHNNQFVDGALLISNCERQVSFMIAQKSWDKPMVGFLARAFHCIPVSRPQDIAFSGAGLVVRDGSTTLRGEGTSFKKQLGVGFSIEISGEPKPLKVKEIVSDTELVLESAASPSETPSKYKVSPKVDQSKMFDRVYTGLKQGRCLGIFPEGGSHDRTDLLPLKAGVAIIALDAMQKHHMTVPIVPVGLNYFKGHRFGGRVVVEFGPPIIVPEAIYLQYESDRHGAVEDLLRLVATGMRSVIVPTPDYHTLQQIYMARRLYLPDGLKLSAEQTMDLNRRFAVGLKKVLDLRTRMGGDTNGMSKAPSSESIPKSNSNSSLDLKESNGSSAEGPTLTPEDIEFIDAFKAEVEDYMSTLKRLGLRDHQVRQIGWWGVGDLTGRLLYLLVTLLMGAIPQMLFNFPLMFIASRWASSEQKKALKASTVKLAARDVVMSYKVLSVLSLIPVLYIFYGVLIVTCTKWTWTSDILVLLFLPFMSYVGMKASEQGVRAWTDILPAFKRLMPATRAEQDKLPERRARLQKKLNVAVKKFGPILGDIYYTNKNVDWLKEMGWFTHAAANAATMPPSPSQDSLAATRKAMATTLPAPGVTENGKDGNSTEAGPAGEPATDGLTKRSGAKQQEGEEAD